MTFPIPDCRRQPDELLPTRPMIFVDRVRCPACEGTEHSTVRSIDQGDGSRLQWRTCRHCNAKFFVVYE